MESLGSRLEILSANVNPREKRGESYPREITRLTQLNPNQLWRKLERMDMVVCLVTHPPTCLKLTASNITLTKDSPAEPMCSF